MARRAMAARPLSLVALLAGSLSATAACGDDPADPPALVGSWRVGANAFDVGAPPAEARQVLTFLADGTVIADGLGTAASGSYTVDGDQLTLVTPRQDAPPDSLTTTFYASATHLVLDAMTSVDAGAGVIGTWQGARIVNGALIDTTVTLRTDHSGRYESLDHATGGAIGIETTWRQQGDDVAVDATISPDHLLQFFATRVDGVLGSPYDRVAP